MAITHSFAGGDSTTDGTWFDDYGRVICTWHWDAAAKTLEVSRGHKGKRLSLASFGAELLTPQSLRDRLPQLAIEVAEQLKGTKFDV